MLLMCKNSYCDMATSRKHLTHHDYNTNGDFFCNMASWISICTLWHCGRSCNVAQSTHRHTQGREMSCHGRVDNRLNRKACLIDDGCKVHFPNLCR